MSYDNLSRLLIGAAIVNIACTAVLVIAAKQHPWAALRDRAGVGIILALIASGGALLGLQQLKIIELFSGIGIVVIAGAFLLVSVPNVVWVISLALGRFDEPESEVPYDGRGDH